MAAEGSENQNPSREDDSAAASDSSCLASSKVPAEKVAFPPPPMWYKTNAIAARHDMWAYISLQQLVLVRPNENLLTENDMKKLEESKAIWPKFEMFGFSKDGYCCLSFCQSAWACLPVKCSPLVTGCREGLVKIWNVQTGECVMYHDLHKESKNLMVNCIDWCSRNPKVIYSMDEEGTLVSWYIPKSTLKAYSFGKIVPASLQCSPHEDNIICIGSKGGNIYIVKTDPAGKSSPNILHRVRHDEEIIATTWCPSLQWRMSKNEDLGHIFASSIQSVKTPVSIRLWGKGAEDRGLYQIGEKEKPFGKVFKNFTPILWAIDPNSGSPMLITTAKRGEIVAFLKDSTLPESIHHVHNGVCVFGLVQCGDMLWSISFEPIIVGFNLRTMTVSCVIPCFRGVCSIAPSPSVGTKVGIGGVDGCIRAIDFAKDYPVRSALNQPVVSYRLKSKVLSLAWHPYKDNLLGFGTDDGIIGLFEIHETQKYTKQFERHVKGAVYAVDWGPIVRYENQEHEEKDKDASAQTLCLYACGGGSAVMVHPSDMKNHLMNIISIANKTNVQVVQKSGLFGNVEEDVKMPTLKSKVADIRWSPDFKIFAVGYNDGRVELYAPPFLELKCWIKCHSRAIQYLSWRTFDFQPDRPDHKDRWLATCANDGTCRLFNLSTVFESLEVKDEPPKLVISSAATLRSPNGERIISSSWSPHNPDLILTVSYDSTGILWNIKEGTPVSRYFGHCHRLVSCAFHPANEYLILSASDEILHDFTLHVWDYRQHPFKENRTDFKIGGKEKPLHIKAREQLQKEKDEGDDDETEVAATSKKDPSSHLHVVDESLIGSSVAPSVTARNQKKKGKGKGSKSLLSSTANMFINSKLDLEEEIRYIVEKLGDQQAAAENVSEEPVNGNGNGETKGDSDVDEEVDVVGKKKFVYLDLLGDYDHCVNLIKLEGQSHAEKGEWEKGCYLATWMGDEDFIEKAISSIDASQITETIVLLAQYSGRAPKPVFKKAASLFADKLILEEEFAKAATFYFLSGHKEKAVEVLVQNKLYRDAVALMKLAIVKNSPIHLATMQKWLVQLTQDGNFETACKVYASLGLYTDALGIIEKRDVDYAWRTGMYLAKLSGDQKKIELLALKYAVDSMAKRDHEGAQQIIEEYKLDWLKPMILVHEGIFNLSNKCRDNVTKEDAGRVFPKGEFKKNLVNSVKDLLPRSSEVVEKLRDTIVVVVAQNKTDAEIILCRSLVFLLFGDKGYEDVFEDYEKLGQTWLFEQDVYLYTSYLLAAKEWLDN